MSVARRTVERLMPGRGAVLGLLLRAFAVIVLGIASLLFDGAPERYDVVGPDLVPNLDFSDGARYWAGSAAGARLSDTGESGVVLWRNGNQTRMPFVLRRLPLPEGAGFLRVSVEVSGREIVWLPGAWDRPNLHIEQFDADRQPVFNWPYRVTSVANGKDWQPVTAVMPISPRTAHLRFVAFMGAQQGVMAIRHLSIRPAVENRTSINIALALKLAWFGLGLACAIPLLGRIGLTRGRLAVLTLSLGILAGSLAPQPEFNNWADEVKFEVKQVARWGLNILRDHGGSILVKRQADKAEPPTVGGDSQKEGAPPSEEAKPSAQAEASDGSSKQAAEAEQGEAELPAEPRRPIATGIGWKAAIVLWLLDNGNDGTVLHFLGYLLLTFAARLAYRQWPVYFSVGSAATLAVATECLQTFVITRDSEWLDLAANGLGIATGAIAALAMLAIIKSWSRRLSRSSAA